MRSRNLSVGLMILAILVLATFGSDTRAAAQTGTVLYAFSFNSGPFAGVISDASGNLYGTTSGGGTFGDGTVYQLSPQSGGVWKQTVLHSFHNNHKDGYQPYAGLAMDAASNLYGTTRFGGPQDDGTVFEVTPGVGGGWTEKPLHSFSGIGTDGIFPYSTPVLDSAGNIYGTTLEGGVYRSGTVFELTLAGGKWTERIVHSFNPSAGDGYNPRAGLILDASGNLYGTTSGCSCSYSNLGTVFELKHTVGGSWVEKVLHSFNSNGVDGFYPSASLTLDSAGNLYGTTSQGGASQANCSTGCGTVFKLTHLPGGSWSETILHNFADDSTDGGFPVGSMTFDSAGNLYSTTTAGGTYADGTVFELTPALGGTWNETVLHNFDNADGNGPSAGVIFDASGNLYGTALGGGAHDGGTVFEIRH